MVQIFTKREKIKEDIQVSAVHKTPKKKPSHKTLIHRILKSWVLTGSYGQHLPVLFKNIFFFPVKLLGKLQLFFNLVCKQHCQ